MNLFYAPDHSVWPISRDRVFVDDIGEHWRWDGVDFDKVCGPELVNVEHGLLMPLLGLAIKCGLRTDPTKDVEAGALEIQAHDAIEAAMPRPKRVAS